MMRKKLLVKNESTGMNNLTFLMNAGMLIDAIEKDLPCLKYQYKDDELRSLFSDINSLVMLLQEYRNNSHDDNSCTEVGKVPKTLHQIGEKNASKHSHVILGSGAPKNAYTDKGPTTTRSTHVGESNYSEKIIQPWDVWIEYALNPWDADMVKRLCRTKEVPGLTAKQARIQDYEKIQHISQERIDQIGKGDPYYTNFKIPPWVE